MLFVYVYEIFNFISVIFRFRHLAFKMSKYIAMYINIIYNWFSFFLLRKCFIIPCYLTYTEFNMYTIINMENDFLDIDFKI